MPNKIEKVTRFWSDFQGGRLFCDDELIWREQLMKILRNGELAKQLWARIEKKISNTAS
jgi:hypothetical protein